MNPIIFITKFKENNRYAIVLLFHLKEGKKNETKQNNSIFYFWFFPEKKGITLGTVTYHMFMDGWCQSAKCNNRTNQTHSLLIEISQCKRFVFYIYNSLPN